MLSTNARSPSLNLNRMRIAETETSLKLSKMPVDLRGPHESKRTTPKIFPQMILIRIKAIVRSKENKYHK